MKYNVSITLTTRAARETIAEVQKKKDEKQMFAIKIKTRREKRSSITI